MISSRYYDHFLDTGRVYHQARPWPHVVMPDFLEPGWALAAYDELRAMPDWWHDPGHPQNQVKKYYAPSAELPELETSLASLARHAPVTMTLLRYLNSDATCQWLSAVTGIPDLRSDDAWLGGGVHRVDPGGFLDIHADFNINWHTGLYRRLNLLIYLNPDWQDSWGGDLEIWDQGLESCHDRVAPRLNQAVLMRIRDDAYHGHPRPLASPPDRSRYSLALYYYTLDRPDEEKAPQHGVVWQNKAG